MVDWAEYRKGVEQQLEQLHRDLEPLESGQMTLHAREAGSDWRDTTREWIAHLKRTIKTYEDILTAIDSKHL